MAWIFTSDGNYVNFNGGGNLWRLHKDSSCISWHWDESGDLFFDVYDQEYTVKAENIADVVIDGVPLSAASGFPTAIRAVFTGLSSGGSSYLSYTVSTTQTGTGELTLVNVFENTIGTITISRSGVGYFIIGSAGLFTENKTWIANTEGNGYAVYPISSSAANAEFYYLKIVDASTIELQFFNATFNNVDPSTLFGNGFIFFLPEIRVYL